MPSATPSITLTPAKLGFVLGLVTLGTIGWNAVGYFKDLEAKGAAQSVKIESIESGMDRLNGSVGTLTDRTDELRIAVTRLTTVMEHQRDAAARAPAYNWPSAVVSNSTEN